MKRPTEVLSNPEDPPPTAVDPRARSGDAAVGIGHGRGAVPQRSLRLLPKFIAFGPTTFIAFGLAGALALALSGTGLLRAAPGFDRAQVVPASFRQTGEKSGVGAIGGVARRIDRSIQRGVRFLAKSQKPNGAFSKRFPVAVTALGGMALLGSGVEYGRGPHHESLHQAIAYLLDRAEKSHVGYMHDNGDSASRMHGHAYAVLFLAQVMGSTSIKPFFAAKIRKTVKAGVQLIESSQSLGGGWYYEPDTRDRTKDEASITVCCLQALRAAKDAGMAVGPETIKKALLYLEKCSNPNGSFRYSSKSPVTQTSYEITAASVSTLDAAGEYHSELHKRGVGYLLDKVGRYPKNPLKAAQRYPFYGNLYAAQVYFQLGGERWKTWSAAAYPRLLAEQAADGGWRLPQFGSEYATAMALLTLEIPLGYLPVFER